jgi:hypothetical protein
MAAAREEKVAALEQALQERERRVAELEQTATAVEAELARSRALAARHEKELESLRVAALERGEMLPDSESPRDASPTPPEAVSTALARVEAAHLLYPEASTAGRMRSVLFRVWLTHPYRAFATAVGLGVCVAMLVSALWLSPDSQPAPSTLASSAAPLASESVADSSALEPLPARATEPVLAVDDAQPNETSADAEGDSPGSGDPVLMPAAAARHEQPPVLPTSPKPSDGKAEPASAEKTAARAPGQKAKAGRPKAPKRRVTTVKPSNKSLDDLFDDVF